MRYETLSAEEIEIILADGDVEAYRNAKHPPQPKSPTKAAPKGLPGLDRGPATEFA